MSKTGMILWSLFAGVALCEEGWTEPQNLELKWNAALSAAMPGHTVTGCGVINSMAAQAVITQCAWIDPDGQHVGYVTQSLDGAQLCGWGERPEALVDDWVLGLASGAESALHGLRPCSAPVRWDMVCQSQTSC